MTRTLNSEKGTNTTIKFLYSYGGKILPRRSDGQLRYVGGHTRILAVDRSIIFSELMVKFGELCGSSMKLKCKLPNEDIDVLVSITCDDDLDNVIEEYDRFSSFTDQDMKIRAILFPIKSLKKISPIPSPVSSLNFQSRPYAATGYSNPPPHKAAAATTAYRYGYGGRKTSPAVEFPTGMRKDAGKFCHRPCCVQGRPTHTYLGPHWNH